jgi:hypothetical protein
MAPSIPPPWSVYSRAPADRAVPPITTCLRVSVENRLKYWPVGPAYVCLVWRDHPGRQFYHQFNLIKSQTLLMFAIAVAAAAWALAITFPPED